LLDRHTMSAAALNIPGQPNSLRRAGDIVVFQYRSVSSLPLRTRKAQPWLKPADGARWALATIRSRTSGSIGRSSNVRTILRLRTTSWNSITPSGTAGCGPS